MTPQEQLKIYAAYLPYKLKIGFEGEDLEHSFVGMDLSDDLMLISPYGDFGRAKIDKCKPILYDLSFLTKEIEHEGERFIPIVKILMETSLLDLSECKFEVSQDEEKFTTIVYVNAENKNGRVIDSMYYDSNIFWHMNNDGSFNPTNPQSEPQELLLMMHFNIFGIPAGDFIEKATLKTEK